jgi:hypothetical protein
MRLNELLNLSEAAAYLGCAERTLRKLVDRSRLRLSGCPVQGPTIQFFQAHPRGSIRFRPVWLDAYIDEGTHQPKDAPLLTKTVKAAPILSTSGFNQVLLDL